MAPVYTGYMESTGKHTRKTFGAQHASDGVSDEVAILWSDREQDRKLWGITPSHRAD